MARRFDARDGRVQGRLDTYEVVLLRELLDGVVRLLRDEEADNVVTARLFPDASPDPVMAADLRDLIQDDLREAKLANARTMSETLPDDGRVDVATDVAEQWLAALNDMRLALGTAIGVTEEMLEEEPTEDDEEALHLFDWLTFLQGSLVDALSDGGVQR